MHYDQFSVSSSSIVCSLLFRMAVGLMNTFVVSSKLSRLTNAVTRLFFLASELSSDPAPSSISSAELNRVSMSGGEISSSCCGKIGSIRSGTDAENVYK